MRESSQRDSFGLSVVYDTWMLVQANVYTDIYTVFVSYDWRAVVQSIPPPVCDSQVDNSFRRKIRSDCDSE